MDVPLLFDSLRREDASMVESVLLETRQQVVVAKEPTGKPQSTGRVISQDVLRGTVMVLMLNRKLRSNALTRTPTMLP